MNNILDGKKMHVIQTSDNGIVNQDTVFEFKQNGNIFHATYDGGKIIKGFLIGQINGFRGFFKYIQTDSLMNIDNGSSEFEIKTDNKKIQLIEKFKWETRDSEGVNIFEEI